MKKASLMINKDNSLNLIPGDPEDSEAPETAEDEMQPASKDFLRIRFGNLLIEAGSEKLSCKELQEVLLQVLSAISFHKKGGPSSYCG